ncbi:MAG: flippase [Myxacorys chilensis ATA2-1-KO14]|jgi:PST family polysaccharide transporter|nr:flippase [Myxacorys chilensis ATA2-1-KO14]
MLSKLANIKRKVTPGTRQIIGNGLWLTADKVLRMLVGLLIGIWVARYLGVEQFGLLNYTIAFAAFFTPIAALGLDSIVIREIVQHPTRKNSLLGSAFCLKLSGGLIGTLLATISIYFFRSDTLSRSLVPILTAGFAFQSFEVIDLWFQSQVQAKNTVLARNTAFAITTVLKVICLQLHAPLEVFAYLYLTEVILSVLGLVVVYKIQNQRFGLWKIDAKLMRQLLKDSSPLIFSGIAILIYMKIDQIMIGQMLGDRAVGVYSAALRVSEVWYFIPVAVASSVSPAIIKARQVEPKQYYQKIQTVFDGMVLISYSISIAMSFLAEPIILRLYGSDYSEAIPILVTHIWASVFVFLGVARSIWLTAENLVIFSLKTTVIGAIVNVGLNMILIPKYAGLGAAIATVVAYLFAVLLSCAFYPRLRSIGKLMLNALTLVWVFKAMKSISR